MKAAGIVSGPIFFGRLIKRSRLTLRSETWMRITWLRTSRTEQCRSGWSAAREIDAASMVMLVRWRQIVSGGQWRAMSHSVHGICGILDNVDSVTYRIQKGEEKTNPTLSATNQLSSQCPRGPSTSFGISAAWFAGYFAVDCLNSADAAHKIGACP
jgi:hypothetical protein